MHLPAFIAYARRIRGNRCEAAFNHSVALRQVLLSAGKDRCRLCTVDGLRRNSLELVPVMMPRSTATFT